MRESGSRLASVLERNVAALIERRQREDANRPMSDRIADVISKFAGSMRFVYIHVVLFGVWILSNTGWLPIPKFDPSLVLLAMFASVEAIFISTFVLITQNRMAAQAEKRAELDLQISLLAEHEVTRLLALTRSIARRLEIEESHDPALGELTEDIAPEHVLDHIEGRLTPEAGTRPQA